MPFLYPDAPRNVYWETTIACGLACQHCRADAIAHRDPRELAGADAEAMLRDIKTMGSMLILTGGDPMLRPDLFDLIRYARNLHIPTSITPSTTPTLTREVVKGFKEAGIAAMGLSLDGPTPEVHDAFRGVPGTFDVSRQALAWAREAGLPVQVNTSVTRETLPHLPALYDLLRKSASPPVRRWSLFLLVPVGRGATLGLPTLDDVQRLFEWIYEIAEHAPFHVGTVEAPPYRRYWVERQVQSGQPDAAIRRAANRMGLGVRDGNGVIFVSHRGDVYPAGFLPYPTLGNVRDQPLSEIYRTAPGLLSLRDMDRLNGKCGACALRWACGGSRARAWAMTGDPMATDPLCPYEPADERLAALFN